MSSPEPTPWGPGLVLAAVAAVIAAGVVTGVYGVVAQTDRLLGVVAVVVVCGGIGPSAWVWRRRPTLRWIGGGALVGLAVGLVAATTLAAAV
ncbi:DUF2537 domain-containing protein [Williamsia deligens]|uniref:DUF2537 domain-containing protein n=1 Tax=Williamsia deligens TaxID=321325 RepID=A0ABW3GCG8_9NOCA|nr:DUF2537 domain-containing protein [Williamsia deligens]MCP2192822.1 Protein of unknown function (DUF2537) [Williamsia deligens]